MARLLKLFLLHLFFFLGASVGQQEEELLYYLGDPQIGFGNSGWQEDVQRFSYVASVVENSSTPSSGVVVAGDLVNVWNNAQQIGGFDGIWPTHFAPSNGGVHLVPGNHDINSACSSATCFVDQLNHFRSSFGANYHAFTTPHHGFARVILVDSESLIVSDLGLNGTVPDPRVLNESETQWRWLENELNSTASREAAHILIVTHHPPFLQEEDEVHQYYNWPLVPRQRLMALARVYGVHHMLCGHTHRTRNITTSDGRIGIYTVAGTAKTFDTHGCGYMTLAMNRTSIDVQYHRLEDPSLVQCVGVSEMSRQALEECAGRFVPFEECKTFKFN